MVPKATNLDTLLSSSTIDQTSLASSEPKPEPHDYYLFLLRAEQGRDQKTRRESSLAQDAAGKFTRLSYDSLWEADCIQRFSAQRNPNLIFQVLPVPQPGHWREKKLALGFDINTRSLSAWLIEPVEIPIEKIHTQPDIWNECRDRHALTECWERRKCVMTIPMNRFYEIIYLAMENFAEYGADILRVGLLRYFNETSYNFHPSMDLVIVIQFAQFLGDFVDLLEADVSQARSLVENYHACQEFFRDILLKASVDVWMTSYEVLKAGMKSPRNVPEVPQETRDKINAMLNKAWDEQRKPNWQPESQRQGPQQQQQQSQSRRQQTRRRRSGGPLPTPYLFAQQTVPGSGPGESVQVTDSRWDWYPWLILTLILLACAWLFRYENYSHILVFVTGFFVLRLIVLSGEGNDWMNYFFRLPFLSTWITEFIGIWDMWVIDALVAIVASELYYWGQRELLAEVACGWITIRAILLFCRWKGVDIESLFQRGWIYKLEGWARDAEAWITVYVPILAQLLPVLPLMMWYFVGALPAAFGMYYLFTAQYTTFFRALFVWAVMRFLSPPLTDWTSWFRLHLMPYLGTLTTKYLAYGPFTIWATHQRQWTELLIGLSLAWLVQWSSSKIWKFSKNGYEAKAFIIWTFLTWRILRARTYIFEIGADYFALLVFARWMSRLGLKDRYGFAFFWAWIVIALCIWRVHMTHYEVVKVPIDILAIFGFDWTSVALLEADGLGQTQRSQSRPRSRRNPQAWNDDELWTTSHIDTDDDAPSSQYYYY